MKMRTINTIIAAGLLCTVGSVQAEDDSGLGIGLGVKAGTLGYGVEVTKSFSDRFSGRVGFNSYSDTDSTTESGIDYDLELDLKTTTALLDFHPFKGSFRLSLGYVANSNRFDMTGRPVAATYDINGTIYNAAEVGQVTGDVTFGSGTYVGLGWGNAGDGKGFGMSVDLGIFQQGSPDLSLAASGPITDPTSPVYDPNFATDLQNEVNSAEKDLEDFQQYPVIALGITYGF